ncbi:MAG: hypothetical protein IT178_12510 [Acidobacteria bacterium]|nr:hypothetical protein [Acidobacteriota bacterium]
MAEIGHDDGGRIDIVLRAPGQPRFDLESKVGSVLTLAQLRRYRSSTAHRRHLIALTKHRPEVPRRELRRAGIQTMRWQDVHRVLVETPIKGALDRFISASFAALLEEESMAYRSQLSLLSIRRAGRLLAAMSDKESAGASVREGFATLDSLSQLLSDVTRDAQDEFTSLTTWKPWGPCYTPHNGESWLEAGLWKGQMRRASYRSLGWGFAADKGGALWFCAWKEQGEDYKEFTKDPEPLMSRQGCLDRDNVWHLVRRALRDWKVK